MRKILLAMLLCLPAAALAQGTARVVESCGTLVPSYGLGGPRDIVQDINGNTCTAGTFSGAPVTNSNPYPVSEFYQKVAEGAVTGYISTSKLGFNAAIGLTNQVISGTVQSAPYMPSTATQVEAVSASVDDTSAGTGMRTIFITGLDPNFNEITEVITLNGTTPVISVKGFIRLYRAIGIGVGTYRGVNAGDIVIRAIGGGTTFLTILAGQSTALTSHFTVPAGKTMFLHAFTLVVEGNKNASITAWVGTGADDVVAPYSPIMASGRTGGTGAVFEQGFGGVPGAIPEKTDFWFSGVAAAATAAITAQYSYILKDN